jgi:hypothetical protein
MEVQGKQEDEKTTIVPEKIERGKKLSQYSAGLRAG